MWRDELRCAMLRLGHEDPSRAGKRGEPSRAPSASLGITHAVGMLLESLIYCLPGLFFGALNSKHVQQQQAQVWDRIEATQ